MGIAVEGRDQYGRVTGTVYRDGANINLALVREGHAWWYRRYAPHDRRLDLAEREARSAARGLWADPEAMPPWEWRRQSRTDR